MTYNTHFTAPFQGDYNDAEPQGNFDLIPKGTIARVVLKIKPGGYRDASRGWTDGYATRNEKTGSVYLSCDFTLMEGPYQGQKVWGFIGLYSAKNDIWATLNRSFVRAILNSARGFREEEDTPQAVAARRIQSFAELDGLEFVARIDEEQDKETGKLKNVIKVALTPDHKAYGEHSGYAAGASYAGSSSSSGGSSPAFSSSGSSTSYGSPYRNQ